MQEYREPEYGVRGIDVRTTTRSLYGLSRSSNYCMRARKRESVYRIRGFDVHTHLESLALEIRHPQALNHGANRTFRAVPQVVQDVGEEARVSVLFGSTIAS